MINQECQRTIDANFVKFYRYRPDDAYTHGQMMYDFVFDLVRRSFYCENCVKAVSKLRILCLSGQIVQVDQLG